MVFFSLACGVGNDGGCPEINCENVQFYVKGKTNCGNNFQGFPPTGGFNLIYGQDDVSNPTEVALNAAGTLLGYDFGLYSNDGAPVATGSSMIEIEFCYDFIQENIADCPSGGETKLVNHFAAPQFIIDDLEFVAGSAMVDMGAGYVAVPDGMVTYDNTTTDGNATMEILEGNNNPNALLALALHNIM